MLEWPQLVKYILGEISHYLSLYLSPLQTAVHAGFDKRFNKSAHSCDPGISSGQCYQSTNVTAMIQGMDMLNYEGGQG